MENQNIMKIFKIPLFLLFAILISLSSCNSNTKKEDASDAEIPEEIAVINILPFLKGKTLTVEDIKFLEIIFDLADKTSRGMTTEVAYNGKTFKVGDALTDQDAAVINRAIESYSDSHPDLVTADKKPEVAEGNARGCGYYCYYYYWDYRCQFNYLGTIR